jgi:hypothetical protein
VKRPGNAVGAKQRTALEKQLHKRLGRLDDPARAAIVTILQIVAGIDRRRAMQFVEAIATIAAFATRGRPRRTR